MTRTAPLASLHAAVVLFGFAGLFAKWVALPAVWIVLGRTAFAALALGAVLAVGRRAPRPGWRVVLNGAVLALHWVSFFEAIRVSTVAIGLLGYASFPVFVLVLERVAFSEAITARRAASCGVVTLGLVMLVPELSLANPIVHGLLWGLLSGLTFAWLAVSSRRAVRGQDAIEVAFWQDLCAAFALVPFVLLASATLTVRDLALLAVLGILCTAVAHSLFIAALGRLSAHTASVVAALEPVYGIALAVLLLGEWPTLRTVAGGVLIVGAAVAASVESRQGAR